MNKGRFVAVLFVIVFLLVLALSVNLLMDLQNSKKEAEALHSQSVSLPAAETPAPTPVPDTPAPTPEPTATPVPTTDPFYAETAAPLPSLVPIPTPTPAVAGDIVASGVFTSETGVPLDLRAEWEAEVLDNDRVLVTVNVYLDSYQLHIKEASRSVNVSVGESYATADSPSVDWDNSAKLETLLATTAHTLTLPVGSGADFPLQVEYYFGGVYSEVELPVIECGGTITINR